MLRVLPWVILSMVETLVLYQQTCKGVSSFAGIFGALVRHSGTNSTSSDSYSCNTTWFNSGYPFSVFTGLLSFLLAFRCSLSLNRYLDARTSLGVMAFKWCVITPGTAVTTTPPPLTGHISFTLPGWAVVQLPEPGLQVGGGDEEPQVQGD